MKIRFFAVKILTNHKMARIKHNDSFNTYKEILDRAKESGLIQLTDDSAQFSGRHYEVGGRALYNFGYCGYLGLEMHDKIKQGAIDYIQKHGTQYGISRAYMTSGAENNLLDLLSQMYGGQKIIVHSSTSSAHIGNIPNLIDGEDAIVLDQQVHFSVQTGAQLCRQKGTHIEMTRHLNFEMLERRYTELSKKYKRVWYLTDGVFSMYGDTTPCSAMKKMLDTHSNLFLYIDDAHGMSWKGGTGGGYIYDQMGVHPKMILNTTMGKGFGVTGGITAFPTLEFYNKVKTFGGPLTYSHPLSPAITGAATASAELHLSSELAPIQDDLKRKIKHCHDLLSGHDLPVLSNAETPIFFLGLGQPKLAYNLVKRVMNEGFYVNIALFPAVSIKNSGFRFSISRHNKLEDIDALVNAIEHHYDKALDEEGISDQSVRKAFKLAPGSKKTAVAASHQPFKTTTHSTITRINRDEWDSCFADKGSFDWEGMHFLEKAFSGNIRERDNWGFNYLAVYEGDTLQAMTFFTTTYVKDDIFADQSISSQIEKERERDPNYLISKTLMMGSLLTEGQHLYINPECKNRKGLLKTLVDEVNVLQEKEGCQNVILRDFEHEETISQFFFDSGFVKLDMPNANVLSLPPFNDMKEFSDRLKSKRKWHFNRDIAPYHDQFECRTLQQLRDEEIDEHFALFENVRKNNLSINIFPYPKKLLKEISKNPNWEVLGIYLKDEQKLVATVWSYKGNKCFCPMLMGMDYTYLNSHKLYKQGLYRILELANNLGYQKVFFGFSADTEKRKLGAQQEARVSYVRATDNYAMDIMSAMSKSKEIAK